MSKKTKTIDELLTKVVQFNDSIPSNWLVVTADTIIDVRDGTHDTPKYVEEGFPLITSKNLKNGKLDFSNVKYISPEDHELICKRSRVDEQDILFAMIGTIGNPVLVEDIQNEFSIKNVGLFKPNRKIIDSKYLYYYLSSPIYLEPLIGNAKGSTQKFVSLGMLRKSPIILPPINEQKRIAEKIERLFAKIDEAKRLIEEVKESFELRRAAILDKAIKGKLVSQSPLDEPADKLLQYIEEQKQHLVKQKKIKKEKSLPSLEQNELLYNIPENWRWVRLGEVIELISGRDVSVKECNNEGVGVPYIMGASNIAEDRLIIERWIEKPSVVGKKGDVLLSVKGTVGKTIIQEVEEAHLSRQIMGLRPIHGVHNGYLKIFIQTYVQVLKEKSKGVIPGISREDVLLAPFPLPPYNEQKRIAEKVDLLLSKLETEKEMVLEVEQKLDLLKQSILNKAFRGELGTNDPTDEHAIELLKEVLKSK
jgi:type I restriction enzyme, S subunit